MGTKRHYGIDSDTCASRCKNENTFECKSFDHRSKGLNIKDLCVMNNQSMSDSGVEVMYNVTGWTHYEMDSAKASQA